MIETNQLIQRVQQTAHGFLDIQKAADEVVAELSSGESLSMAYELYHSEIHQVRCLAVFIFARFVATSDDVLTLLKNEVSRDSDWRVQEILAKAFDRYCSDVGYENAIPTINSWLADAHPNVRRAVTEGLRVWTGRPYFSEHPQVAIQMLSQFRADDSEYLRKSVGNALRDISKKHSERVQAELQLWDISDKRTNQTYKLAVKFIQKKQG
jgi:3-methyladenine DNA glycosylase AlkD